MPSRRRLRLWALSAVAVAVAAIVGASCQNNSKSPSELKAQATRLRALETGVDKVSALTSDVNAQIQALQGKDEGLTAEVAGLSGEIDALSASIADLKKSIDSLSAEIQANKTATASLQKKVTDLSSKVSSIDDRVWLLESRYNDHLRKYHGGG